MIIVNIKSIISQLQRPINSLAVIGMEDEGDNLEIIGLSQGKPKGRLYIGKRKERGGL
ncbi:MAG: hypothetical protein WC571_04020 [Candidatus Omnitrophota bacterium]